MRGGKIDWPLHSRSSCFDLMTVQQEAAAKKLMSAEAMMIMMMMVLIVIVPFSMR